MISVNEAAVRLGDAMLGWTRSFPRDVTVVILAGLTAAMLLGIRCLCADSTELRMLHRDLEQLRRLRREARSRHDSEASRHRGTVRRLLAIRRLQLETLPVLFGLVPALLVLAWGSRRLEYLPLAADAPFTLTAKFPASAIGGVVHVVPGKELRAVGGWIRVVEPDGDGSSRGTASWQLTGNRRPLLTSLLVRFGATTLEHPVGVGTGAYLPPVLLHSGDVETRVTLKVYQPFGFVPDISRWGLRPWLIGVVLLTLLAYLGAKHLLRIP